MRRKNKVKWKGHRRVRNFNGKEYILAMTDAPNTKHNPKEISEILGEPVSVRTTQGTFEKYRVTNIWVRDKPKRKKGKKR